MDSTYLLIFLAINLFVLGAVVALALQHAYAHFRPQPKSTTPTAGTKPVRLPPEVRKRLLEAAEANYQKVLDRANDELEASLAKTTEQLNSQLEAFGMKVVEDEMSRYQHDIYLMRQQAETIMERATTTTKQNLDKFETELKQQQAELTEKMLADVEADKQQLIEQLDTKLADAVTAFLLETMQHEVDLGAQSQYLIAMLDKHKSDLSQDLKG